MARRNISSGSPFESQIGYSRAVVCHPWVFVSGTTGYDPQTRTLPPDVESQTRNTLATITAALASAGATPADVVRARYILPDRADFPHIWPLLREYFGTAMPAATMVQAGLMEVGMRVEIEVTALIGAGGGGAGEGTGEGPPPPT